MLPDFSYARPTSLADAIREASAPGAVVHAGGTDLLGCLRDGVIDATRVVSLGGVPELRGIRPTPSGGLRLGALTTLAELTEHPAIVRDHAALAQGAAAAASPQLRGQGTLGGNLCQHVRCAYYRGGVRCLRRGGTTCSAANGDNELHAIFGAEAGCHAVHPSDTAPALVALGATVHVAGPDGARVVDAASFAAPLAPGEIVVAVELPPPGPGRITAYRKVRARACWDFALAGVALAIQAAAGRVTAARIVLAGVAPVAWPATAAAAALIGRSWPLRASDARDVAGMVTAGARPLEHNAYKVTLVSGLVEQALVAAAPR